MNWLAFAGWRGGFEERERETKTRSEMRLNNISFNSRIACLSFHLGFVSNGKARHLFNGW